METDQSNESTSSSSDPMSESPEAPNVITDPINELSAISRSDLRQTAPALRRVWKAQRCTPILSRDQIAQGIEPPLPSDSEEVHGIDMAGSARSEKSFYSRRRKELLKLNKPTSKTPAHLKMFVERSLERHKQTTPRVFNKPFLPSRRIPRTDPLRKTVRPSMGHSSRSAYRSPLNSTKRSTASATCSVAPASPPNLPIEPTEAILIDRPTIVSSNLSTSFEALMIPEHVEEIDNNLYTSPDPQPTPSSSVLPSFDSAFGSRRIAQIDVSESFVSPTTISSSSEPEPIPEPQSQVNLNDFNSAFPVDKRFPIKRRHSVLAYESTTPKETIFSNPRSLMYLGLRDNPLESAFLDSIIGPFPLHTNQVDPSSNPSLQESQDNTRTQATASPVVPEVQTGSGDGYVQLPRVLRYDIDSPHYHNNPEEYDTAAEKAKELIKSFKVRFSRKKPLIRRSDSRPQQEDFFGLRVLDRGIHAVLGILDYTVDEFDYVDQVLVQFYKSGQYTYENYHQGEISWQPHRNFNKITLEKLLDKLRNGSDIMFGSEKEMKQGAKPKFSRYVLPLNPKNMEINKKRLLANKYSHFFFFKKLLNEYIHRKQFNNKDKVFHDKITGIQFFTQLCEGFSQMDVDRKKQLEVKKKKKEENKNISSLNNDCDLNHLKNEVFVIPHILGKLDRKPLEHKRLNSELKKLKLFIANKPSTLEKTIRDVIREKYPEKRKFICFVSALNKENKHTELSKDETLHCYVMHIIKDSFDHLTIHVFDPTVRESDYQPVHKEILGIHKLYVLKRRGVNIDIKRYFGPQMDKRDDCVYICFKHISLLLDEVPFEKYYLSDGLMRDGHYD